LGGGGIFNERRVGRGPARKACRVVAAIVYAATWPLMVEINSISDLQLVINQYQFYQVASCSFRNAQRTLTFNHLSCRANLQWHAA